MIFVAVALAMLVKDLLGTAVMVLVARRHPWRAGLCDGFADLASLFCVGATGAEVLRHGWSLWSTEAVCGLVVGSLLGTVIGEHLGEHLGVKAAD